LSQSITVVGAGICGLCTALALHRKGFEVSLFERDSQPPGGNPDRAFFEWPRRGAAQFRHPHAFLGLMCSVLEDNYPDLLDDFFAAGARKVKYEDMVPPRLQAQYKPQPGDEQLWVLMCRRATMETVLRHYVSRTTNVKVHNTTLITGIEAEATAGGLSVTGLQATDRAHDNEKSVHHSDIVVDASGRSSKFHQWLRKLGAEIGEQNDDAEIVYYTRHYKLHEGVEEPSRHSEDPAAGDLGYMKYGVFPGDGGNFALIICLPNAETDLREAVKDPDKFDAICRTVPGLAPWIDPDRAAATTDSFGIGQIHAVWRNYVTDAKPAALNFFAIGDACARTNPLYGRGCSTGALHAHILADLLAETGDPMERALRFAAATEERIRPIFDASLSEDKNGIRRAAASMQGLDRNKATSLKKYFGLAFGDALAAAMRDEIHVHRGIMRTVNLVEKPGAFLGDPKIRRTIYRYMLRGRKRNAKARLQRGLSRTEMLEHIATLS
jgi:2-polyprenyl-6-methoxyphenol hydroxylase-like FAD-dependent oxidoreductase